MPLSFGMGLLSALGQGLETGVKSYDSAQRLKLQQDQQDLARERLQKAENDRKSGLILKALKEGYRLDETGNPVETEEGKVQRLTELAHKKAQTEVMRARALRGQAEFQTQFGGGGLDAPPPAPVAPPAPPTPFKRGLISAPQAKGVPSRNPQGDPTDTDMAEELRKSVALRGEELDPVSQGLLDRANDIDKINKNVHGKDGSAVGTIMQGSENPKFIKGLINKYPKDTGPVYDRKELFKYQNMLNKETRELAPIIKGAQTINKFTELAKTNPMTAAALPVMLARAVGEKGPLSNFDIQMWGGSKAVISRLNRAASLMATGRLPEEDLKFIQEIATGLGKAAEERLSNAENEVVAKFQANYGGTPEWAYKKVTGRDRKQEQPKQKKIKQRLRSPSRPGKVKVIYDDDTSEVIDG